MGLPTTYSWVLTTGGTSAQGGSVGRGVAGNRISGQGKNGLAFPFGSNGRGGLALVSGQAQLEKLIILNLSDLESMNPFQGDIGLGADMIFAIASDNLRVDIRRRIAKLFRTLQLQDRARLKSVPTFKAVPGEGELTCDIEYINLEEDKPDAVSVKFSLVSSVVSPASTFA